MLITNTLLAGGALYAYLKQRGQDKDKNVLSAELQLAKPLAERTEDARHHTGLATLSIGLTLAGAITASPLALLGVPLNIYNNIPVFQEAIATIGGKDEKLGSILLSLIIAGTISSNQIFATNLIDWISQRSRLTGAKLRQNGLEKGHVMSETLQQWVGQAMGRTPDTVWAVDGQTQIEVPFESLNVGDTVMFREGEFISVTGEVVRGEAEVFNWSILQNPPIKRIVGDHVQPRMMLLKGTLFVKVEQIA